MTLCLLTLSMMTISMIKLSMVTLSMITLSMMTVSMMTVSMMTVSMMTVSMMTLSITFKILDTQQRSMQSLAMLFEMPLRGVSWHLPGMEVKRKKSQLKQDFFVFLRFLILSIDFLAL
jgi:hypothetical protein